MKKKLYEHEYTQGPIHVSGKSEGGEHRLFLGNKNSPMVLADMNPVHTQTPGNARRLAASWNACLSYETKDLEETGSIGVCTLRLAQERDTAWRELREIREAIKADENESTADEVRSLVSKYETARRTLEDHGPEDHNVTNQQYVDLRLFLIEIGTSLIDLQELTSHHVQWTARGLEMKVIHDRLEKIEAVIAKFKEQYHVD